MLETEAKPGSPNIDLAFTWSILFQQVVTQIYRYKRNFIKRVDIYYYIAKYWKY